MNVLVTGSTGFVGKHLVARLLADGHDVHVLLRNSSDASILGRSLDRVTVHRHDGSTEGLIKVVEDSNPTTVLHLASLFLGEHQRGDVESLIASNVLFSTQVVEAMIANGVIQLVNTGTSWQHYSDENYNPVNLYAATKQAFRSILTYYIEVHGLRVINLELFDTYGPDDHRGKLFALLERLRTSGDSLAMSPGEQEIDLVFISDVASAFVTAMNRFDSGMDESEETFSVGTGSPISLKQLVETFESVIGAKLPIEWGGRAYRTREVMSVWSRGMALPDWTPEVPLEEGIRRLVDSNV